MALGIFILEMGRCASSVMESSYFSVVDERLQQMPLLLNCLQDLFSQRLKARRAAAKVRKGASYCWTGRVRVYLTLRMDPWQSKYRQCRVSRTCRMLGERHRNESCQCGRRRRQRGSWYETVIRLDAFFSFHLHQSFYSA